MIGEGNGAVRLVDVSGNTIQLDTSGRVTIGAPYAELGQIISVTR